MSVSFYNVNYPSKIICPLHGISSYHRFLTGTSSHHKDNSLYMLEYNDEAAKVTVKMIYPHRNEIIDIVTVPHDPTLVFTTYLTEENEYKTTLWRMSGLEDIERQSAKVIIPESLSDGEINNSNSNNNDFIPGKPTIEDNGNDGINDIDDSNDNKDNKESNEIIDGELYQISDIKVDERVKEIIVKPYLEDSDPLEFLTVHDHHVCLWILEDSEIKLQNTHEINYDIITCGSWDPFHTREYAIGINNEIHFIDTRYNKYYYKYY